MLKIPKFKTLFKNFEQTLISSSIYNIYLLNINKYIIIEKNNNIFNTYNDIILYTNNSV